MPATAARCDRSFGELTRLVFGAAMTVDAVFELLDVHVEAGRRAPEPTAPTTTRSAAQVWVGSIGYERYRVNTDFAARLRDAGVECLIDVRQLPISRRRGFAKSALAEAIAGVGVEYVHMRELGNPKPTRDLYKSGRTEEGRAGYEGYLLGEQHAALVKLASRLAERRCALMCVEHDAHVCHRSVIFDALRDELGVAVEVAEIG
jgi:uncharacterized protein (DUF488 family)